MVGADRRFRSFTQLCRKVSGYNAFLIKIIASFVSKPIIEIREYDEMSSRVVKIKIIWRKK